MDKYIVNLRTVYANRELYGFASNKSIMHSQWLNFSALDSKKVVVIHKMQAITDLRNSALVNFQD